MTFLWKGVVCSTPFGHVLVCLFVFLIVFFLFFIDFTFWQQTKWKQRVCQNESSSVLVVIIIMLNFDCTWIIYLKFSTVISTAFLSRMTQLPGKTSSWPWKSVTSELGHRILEVCGHSQTLVVRGGWCKMQNCKGDLEKILQIFQWKFSLLAFLWGWPKMFIAMGGGGGWNLLRWGGFLIFFFASVPPYKCLWMDPYWICWTSHRPREGENFVGLQWGSLVWEMGQGTSIYMKAYQTILNKDGGVIQTFEFLWPSSDVIDFQGQKINFLRSWVLLLKNAVDVTAEISGK